MPFLLFIFSLFQNLSDNLLLLAMTRQSCLAIETLLKRQMKNKSSFLRNVQIIFLYFFYCILNPNFLDAEAVP